MKGKRLFYNASKRAAEELRDIPIGFAAAVKDYVRQSIPVNFFFQNPLNPQEIRHGKDSKIMLQNTHTKLLP